MVYGLIELRFAVYVKCFVFTIDVVFGDYRSLAWNEHRTRLPFNAIPKRP